MYMYMSMRKEGGRGEGGKERGGGREGEGGRYTCTCV